MLTTPRSRLAGVLAAGAVLAACSSGGGIKPLSQAQIRNLQTTTTAAASTSTTSTTVDPTKAAILAGYRASWADYLAVVTRYPIQPMDPRLAAHTTAVELDTIHISLTKASLASEYAVGTIDLAPVVSAMSDSMATIRDCYFDHTKIVNGKTGITASPGDTQRTLINATMVLDAGTWKMSNYQKVGSGCTPSV